jgi:hypothetical protein
MDTWKRFHNEFEALMEEEGRIVQQRAGREWFYAHVSYRGTGEFGSWSLLSSTTESLYAQFESLVTEAGIAPGSPPGTLPDTYWLHRLFADLHVNNSPHVPLYDNNGGIIERLFEACAIYCARLYRRSLEKAVLSCQEPGLERSTANQRTEGEEGELSEAGGKERERSERRRAVVTPILVSKKWKRGTWATKAGVGKNSVYDYLNGKRNLSVENRQALG